MKRSDLVPGVLFQLPSFSVKFYVYRMEEDGATGFRKWGYLTRDGQPTESKLKSESDPFWHIRFKRNGIQVWTCVESVFMYSKTIPFEYLTKVEIPSPATNPISI